MTSVLPPWLLLVLATLFWGLNTVIGRAVVGDIPPVAMSFWRWTIATLFILPFAQMSWSLSRRNRPEFFSKDDIPARVLPE